MENRIGIIVGASPIGTEKSALLSLLKDENTYKIAADGGIRIFIEENIVPDEWLGDMDSTKELENTAGLQTENPILKDILKTVVSCVKDDTDMALGLKKAFDANCTEVVIFGGLGGKRISHSLANVQLLHNYAVQGKKVTMISENTKMFVLHNDSVEYPETRTGFLSIFALDEKACGVSIEGLFYEYHGDLTNKVALGVSNEFIGKKAKVTVKEGSLLLIEEGK